MVKQKGFELEMEEPNSLTIKITREPELDFAVWKETIPIKSGKEPAIIEKEYIQLNDHYSLLQDLQCFNVADHTPMQSMQFIIELQNKMKLVKKMPE
jgi:hypothetical protein